jgi:hypothetical protein
MHVVAMTDLFLLSPCKKGLIGGVATHQKDMSCFLPSNYPMAQWDDWSLVLPRDFF